MRRHLASSAGHFHLGFLFSRLAVLQDRPRADHPRRRLLVVGKYHYAFGLLRIRQRRAGKPWPIARDGDGRSSRLPRLFDPSEPCLHQLCTWRSTRCRLLGERQVGDGAPRQPCKVTVGEQIVRFGQTALRSHQDIYSPAHTLSDCCQNRGRSAQPDIRSRRQPAAFKPRC